MKIAFIGQPEYFRFCYESDLSEKAIVREFPFHFNMKADDFSDLIDFSPDFSFFFRGEFFPIEVLGKITGKKIALSSEPFPRHLNKKLIFTLDSLRRYFEFRSRIKYRLFHYVFHYDESSLSFLRRDGLYLSGSFPFPVATKIYFDRELKKNRDIFFIGRSTIHREKYFGELKHKHDFLHICHGVYGPSLIDYICSARINMNIHAEAEISWEPRVQMLMACGAFVISEKITPNEYLRPGVDFIEINSPAEAKEAVSYYLEHPEERQRIANNAYQKVQELFSAERIFLELIKNVTEEKIPNFHVTKPSFLLEMIEKLRRITSFNV